MPSLPMSALTRLSAGYPYLLTQITKPPELLYYRGAVEVLDTPSLSVVGSRKMSEYGARVVRLLLPPLVRAGLTIVSGLAYGIDSFAHQITLEQGGRAVAVLGSGLDNVYPTANRRLAAQIVQSGGCLLSEYESKSEPLPMHFPERNRIVAGLSPVILIIEAGEHSGTSITARQALESGRDVCVVPADITREQSRGVHQLLKQGAKPVTCPEDVLELYPSQANLPILIEKLKPALTGSLANLYDLISRGCNRTEVLLKESGLSVSELQSVLSVLELDGYISNLQNKWQKI